MPGTDTDNTPLYPWLRLLVSDSQGNTDGGVEGRMDILIILGVLLVCVVVMAYGEGPV